MKLLWRIPDFLDLEYFFIQDRELAEEKGEAALRDRDRSLYLEEIQEDVTDSDPDREWLIHRWLQVRRSRENLNQSGQALLPGRMWYELYGLFWALCSFLAMAAGAGVAYSFLSYSGKQPVNVSLFFLVFVIFQVVFLLFLLFSFVSRRVRGRDLRSSLLLSLVNKGLNRFLFKVRKYGLDSMESGKRAQFAAALAAVRARGKGYGPLFFWPLFLLFQLFGIAFNFGLLGSVLVKVATSDLAFGWQSTIALSSQFVSTLVQWVALPWSWLLGPDSYPSLAQIEGSRMILKEGMYHLASEDLASWWPFLCLAICCYCLLPRMLLFVAGTRARKRSLARLSFHRPDHNQLLHRLLTPRLETKIRDKESVVPSPESDVTPIEEVSYLEEEVLEETGKDAVNGELLALIPDELFADCDPLTLEQLCRQRFGYGVRERIRINEEYSDNSEILAHLQKSSDSCPSLLILQESWQPPIQEVLAFVRELRATCGGDTHIIMALVGKPRPETIFTAVTGMDQQIWQQKSASLVDPCLQVTPLVEV